MCIDVRMGIAQRLWRHQRGVSLLELIVFIVIVSTSLAGILTMLNSSVQHSADPMIQKQMLTIAEGLLDEVEQMPYTACDPVTNINSTALTTAQCGPGTSYQHLGYPTAGVSPRSSFNNIGNYCSNAGPKASTCSTLQLGSSSTLMPDMTGSTTGAPAGYWATIDLTPEALWGVTSTSTAATAAAAAAMNVLRVKVVVHFGSDTLTLETYRTRWSPAPMIVP
jgi:MSHA pilin protein MshD